MYNMVDEDSIYISHKLFLLWVCMWSLEILSEKLLLHFVVSRSLSLDKYLLLLTGTSPIFDLAADCMSRLKVEFIFIQVLSYEAWILRQYCFLVFMRQFRSCAPVFHMCLLLDRSNFYEAAWL